MTLYQIGALQAFAVLEGTRLQHVKPHGALYHMAVQDSAIAQAIVEAVAAVDKALILFGLDGSELIKAAEKARIKVAREVFADRSYQPDGSLTPRTMPDAFIHEPEEAVNRMIRMVKEGKVKATDGTDRPIQADTVCVHGDGPQALSFVQQLQKGLEKNDILVRRIAER
jgi:UPF0271 protein